MHVHSRTMTVTAIAGGLRRLTTAAVAGAALFAGTLAIPTQAHAAALECGSNWPHHRANHGSITGGYTTFHICWDNHYNARLDWSSSYVKDTKADGKAPRVYLHLQNYYPSSGWTWGWSASPLATASGGRGSVKHYQFGDAPTRYWAIYLCIGPKQPWRSGHVCTKAL